MQECGYQIVPVNPNCTEILCQICYPSLLDIPYPVDIVNVFRRSEEVLPIAQQAVQIGAKCLWQQLGVANFQAHELAKTHGLLSIMNQCIKIEHAKRAAT